MLKVLCAIVSVIVVTGCSPVAIDKRTNRFSKPKVMLSKPPLTISLDKSFPEKLKDGTHIRANFQTVAQDVLQVVQSLFSGAKLPDSRPIVCYVSSESVPRVDVTTNPAIIWIGLALPKESLQKLDYTRFSYQLSHELGHVMLDARRSNGLIETLADAISHQALDDMTKLWHVKYSDFEPWKKFAPHFQEYREQREKEKLLRLPGEIQDAARRGRWSEIASYLRKRQSDLDENPFNDTGLAIRNLGAMALRSDTIPWGNLAGIASLTKPSPAQDNQFREDLSTDISRAPSDAQDALRRLGR